MSNIQEVRARGAHVIAVATEGNTEIADIAEHVLYLPRTEPELQAALAILPLQQLAYAIAKPARARHRQAAQPGQDRHGRVTAPALAELRPMITIAPLAEHPQLVPEVVEIRGGSGAALHRRTSMSGGCARPSATAGCTRPRRPRSWRLTVIAPSASCSCMSSSSTTSATARPGCAGWWCCPSTAAPGSAAGCWRRSSSSPPPVACRGCGYSPSTRPRSTSAAAGSGAAWPSRTTGRASCSPGCCVAAYAR